MKVLNITTYADKKKNCLQNTLKKSQLFINAGPQLWFKVCTLTYMIHVHMRMHLHGPRWPTGQWWKR